MGMFDSVYVACPRCGTRCEFQSKAGECCCDSYSLDDAPTEILLDIINEPNWCHGCKSWFALIDPAIPPGPPARPNITPAPVRDAGEREYSAYKPEPDRLRWWIADFSFADLVSDDSEKPA